MNLTDTATGLAEEMFGSPAIPQDVRYDDKGEAVALTLPFGELLLRFVRDRGEDFVDVAARRHPQDSYQIDDVDVAFGWKTIDDVLAKRAPEPLRDILMRLHNHAHELTEAFNETRFADTLRVLESAQSSRARAFEARLR